MQANFGDELKGGWDLELKREFNGELKGDVQYRNREFKE